MAARDGQQRKHPDMTTVQNPRQAMIARAERAILDVQCRSDKPSAWMLAAAVVDAIPNRDWYAVSTKQYQEKRAAEELRNLGFIVSRPKIFRHPDDDDFVDLGRMEYRYPGYVFVFMDLAAGEMTVVERAPGVEGVIKGAVGDGNSPRPLPPGTIDTLRRFEDADFDRATMKRPDKREDLYEGMAVEVDDRTHHLFEKAGTLMSLDRKVAKVLIGMVIWNVDPLMLRKVFVPKKKGKAA